MISWATLRDPIAQAVLWTALCALLVTVAIYVLGKIRETPAQQEPEVHEMISKFRELHSRGELSDAEFRTIKTNLIARCRQPTTGDGEKG
jgi:uncharacterized membrane protein